MENNYNSDNVLFFFDTTSLKLIAAATMLVDHIGAILYPGYRWFRIVGRIAMPVFCFCAAEGFHHTKDRTGYMLRLLVFAIISEYPFDMAFDGYFSLRSDQNVMFTFLFAAAGIRAFESIREKAGSFTGDIAGCLAAAFFAAAADAFNSDYGRFGVILVYLFYFMRSDPLLKLAAAAAYITAAQWGGTQLDCLLAFPLIALYNGKRGKGLKYYFYAFYPLHLLVLYLISKRL